MKAYSSGAQREALERFQQFREEEAQNN